MTTHNRSRNELVCLAFLVGSAGLASCTSYEPSHYEQARERRESAAGTLSAKGGSVVEKTYPQGAAWVVDLGHGTIDDETLQALKSLGRISELYLNDTSITDDQFVSIANRETLSFLYKLDIRNTAITDRGFVAAAPLPILSEISIAGTKITDSGVAEFKRKHPAKNPLGLKLKIEK